MATFHLSSFSVNKLWYLLNVAHPVSSARFERCSPHTILRMSALLYILRFSESGHPTYRIRRDNNVQNLCELHPFVKFSHTPALLFEAPLFQKRAASRHPIGVRPHLQSAEHLPLLRASNRGFKSTLSAACAKGVHGMRRSFPLSRSYGFHSATLPRFCTDFAPISIYTASLYRIKLSIFNPHSSPVFTPVVR